MIYYGKQHITSDDIEEVIKTLKSPMITQGEKVAEFEKKLAQYCKVKYAVSVANGTAALHLAVKTLELEKGYNGITTALSFVATANAMLYNNIKPVFVDIKKDHPIIDINEIEKRINSKTKLIISVDYAGIPVDYDKINSIAKKYSLYTISDAAHSLGSKYKNQPIGGQADLTTFSFHPVKTITTGEGGAILTNNEILYKKLLILRNHGITKNKNNFINKQNIHSPWYYEMQQLGFNYRLTDFQCALGISQLNKIENFIKRRKEIAHIYDKNFKNLEEIKIIHKEDAKEYAYHLYPILVNFNKIKKTKEDMFEFFKNRGIMLQVHYIPIVMQPYYQKLGYNKKNLPNTMDFYNKVVSLPIYYSLTEKEINHVIKTVKDFLIK